MAIMSKKEIMDFVIAGKAREVFEHSDEGRFDVTAMREFAKKNVIAVMVPVELTAPILKTIRVIDWDRVNSLDLYTCMTDPAMAVILDRPGVEIEHLMIDGIHRCLRLEKEGVKHQPVWMLEEKHVIRPDMNLMMKVHDWGDIMVDGKIVKRS